MKEKQEIAKDLDFIREKNPKDYLEIENLIKYTKKLTEMKAEKNKKNIRLEL
ncbi:hypothetical protein P3F01_15665 [Clostridium perfringens]|uniref:hypothetical protein n=1 Tax=Clostridium perfringens TaxID=1502 RepID=UPI0028E10120|nr:hypothetical protein [Clostridium perfringens]MDT9337797.1 hypothetical protein [Clostridium perfringens]MDT9345554.1 hypothetical protein [Clostridium perfringens]MDT9348797.1 hypothetical protein [Clostridium perfringens]MDT9354601.1 hypothetical protein [Clostridium perfringens]